MGNKIFRKFKNIYNLDLLIISAADYNIGGVVEYDNGKLDVENYLFISDLLIEESKQKELKKIIFAIPQVAAQLANCKIDKSFGLETDINIPNIGLELSGNYATKSVLNFSFKDITRRSVSGELKEELRSIIKSAKINHKKHYRKDLKNLYIFDELYYSEKVIFEIDNTNEGEIRTNLAKINIAPKIKQNSDKIFIVEIASDGSCPFAAKIESLKDYID